MFPVMNNSIWNQNKQTNKQTDKQNKTKTKNKQTNPVEDNIKIKWKSLLSNAT